MTRYIIRRSIQIIPLVFGITLISFILIRSVPGGPLSAFELNPSIGADDIDRIKRNLGLDRPLWQQYVSWLFALLQGDLGRSMADGRSVSDVISGRMGNTILLVGLALVVEVVVAVPLGVYAALHHRRFFDQITNVFAAAAVAVPGFWLGILLILFFAVQFQNWGLPWLPSGGMYTIIGGGDLLDRIRHLILPVTALAVPSIAATMRYMRSSMLEQLGQDYVRTARAKGVGVRRATYHAFRNSLLPLVTLLGLNLAGLFSGALVVEIIFSWPGMGQLAFTAAQQRDYSMLMALVVVTSFMVILGNLLADIFYGVLDPRVKY
jgi:peptide/nickel transport system permease protein